MGEYLHAAAVDPLRRLGLLAPLLAAGALRITDFELSFGRRRVRLPIDPGSEHFGLACKQGLLLRALQEHAAQLPGIAFLRGRATALLRSPSGSVGGVMAVLDDQPGTLALTARCVVGADGRNSAVRHWAGLKTRQRVGYYLVGGLARSEAADAPVVRVRVEAGRLYMLMPFGRGEYRCLVEAPSPDAGLRQHDPRLVLGEALRRLSEVFALPLAAAPDRVHLTPCPEMTLRRLALPGLVLTGDASGVLNPLTASGMTAGLHDGEHLVPLLRAALLDHPAGTLLPRHVRSYGPAKRRFAAGRRLRIRNFANQMWASRSERWPHRLLTRTIEHIYHVLETDPAAAALIASDVQGQSDPLAAVHWAALLLRAARPGKKAIR